MNKLTKVLCSFLFFLFYTVNCNAGQDIKMAFVDLQKALINCEGGQEAQKKLEQQVQKMKKEMEEAQEEILKLDELLKKQAMMLTEEVKGEKGKELEKKYRDFRRMEKDYKYEYQQRENELTKKILLQLAEIVKELGEKKKYTVIFEKKLLLYVSDALDLTDEIIKIHNKRYFNTKK
ncbi:MAG: OmpH family outer membrane protein [Thermodesulfobacteriota bacterium]|nr:OmpH family outer membrane protein [Thermodesulfobacteriota bacterium]